MKLRGRRLRGRINSAHVIAIVALFVALGGSALAVSKNSVGKKQLKKNAVVSSKIKKNAVTTRKIKNKAVITDKLSDLVVITDKIADAAVTFAKLAPDSVDSSKIVDGSIANGDIGTQQVTTDNLDNNSVTAVKILDGQVRAGELGAFTVVSNVQNVANNTNGNITANCPVGSVMISGGGFTGSFTNMNLVTSIPSGNGWRVEARNTTGATQPLTARVNCLNG